MPEGVATGADEILTDDVRTTGVNGKVYPLLGVPPLGLSDVVADELSLRQPLQPQACGLEESAPGPEWKRPSRSLRTSAASSARVT